METSPNEIDIKLNVIDKLQKYTIRTFMQLCVHIAVAIIIAVIIAVVLCNKHVVNSDSLVVIISSMSAASGILLAVTLSLAMFFGRHTEDWRDRLIHKLIEDRGRIERQMEKSAQYHPEISNRLGVLYLKSIFYIPGQAINTSEIYEADRVFSDWAKEQAVSSGRRFSFGDLGTYDSFEKHLFDASMSNTELRHTLIELSVVERASRIIITFAPLIITWLMITVFTMVFAIIGAMSVMPFFMNIPVLIIPLYLFLVAIFALTKDITAILRHMRVKETGTAQAIATLSDRGVTRNNQD